MSAPLSRWQRVLLWDFDRGSWAYLLLALLALLALLLLPPAWLADPLVQP